MSLGHAKSHEQKKHQSGHMSLGRHKSVQNVTGEVVGMLFETALWPMVFLILNWSIYIYLLGVLILWAGFFGAGI